MLTIIATIILKVNLLIFLSFLSLHLAAKAFGLYPSVYSLN